jgi:hypothetical protein
MYQICLLGQCQQYSMQDSKDIMLLTKMLEKENLYYTVEIVEKSITTCTPSDFGWRNSAFRYWGYQ